MIALLDVNALVAAALPNHVHHEPARRWLWKHGSEGWATCPVTESGFIRLCSNPVITGRAVQPRDAVGLLARLVGWGSHEFWADDVSPISSAHIDWGRVTGHKQVTDVHLLELARRRGGALVSFDRRLDTAVVDGAAPVIRPE